MNEIQMKTDIPKLKLTRGQRGGYGWDISVPHLDLEVAVEKVKEIDTKLRKHFGGEEI
tara:strand:+ start:573 stop:746 length:174 start_codon:yes stop_codon:yes gene_type:complete